MSRGDRPRRDQIHVRPKLSAKLASLRLSLSLSLRLSRYSSSPSKDLSRPSHSAMSRPFSITSLRAALPSPRPSPAAFSLPLASGSSSAFSTTSPASASKTRILAKRKKAAHLAKRAALSAEVNAGRPDPVLGYVVSTAGPSRSSASTSAAPSSSPWDGCRLQRILLRPEAIYAIPPPDYSVDQSPLHHLPGLSQTDKDILFGAVPHASTELAFAGAADESNPQQLALGEQAAQEQKKRSEMMHRILDLRNASKRGIEVTNRQRVIDEFGRKEPGKGTDTGSSEVQGE
jgi:hypothetical protein